MSRIAYHQSISEAKLIVAEKLIESDKIVRALSNNQTNFLDIPTSNPEELIYENIFPYGFIPQTADEKKTYITLGTGQFERVESKYKSGIIRINIFTHQDLMKTDYGTTRTDFILQEIDELFNGAEGISIGQFQYERSGQLMVDNTYYGCYVEYKMWEFNRL